MVEKMNIWSLLPEIEKLKLLIVPDKDFIVGKIIDDEFKFLSTVLGLVVHHLSQRDETFFSSLLESLKMENKDTLSLIGSLREKSYL